MIFEKRNKYYKDIKNEVEHVTVQLGIIVL